MPSGEPMDRRSLSERCFHHFQAATNNPFVITHTHIPPTITRSFRSFLVSQRLLVALLGLDYHAADKPATDCPRRFHDFHVICLLLSARWETAAALSPGRDKLPREVSVGGTLILGVVLPLGSGSLTALGGSRRRPAYLCYRAKSEIQCVALKLRCAHLCASYGCMTRVRRVISQLATFVL